MQYASQNLIPVTLELGGKSPNVFFEDVALHTDDAYYYDKALEGFTMFALNQGEVCTCPSRSLIQRSIYDQFLGDGLERVKKVRQGNPLDPETMIGAQASNDQLEKILSYIDIGKQGGAKLLTGGERVDLGGDLSGGYYVAPTVFEGTNDMRIFQEEIFGPVLSVTSFDDFDDAISIANDTLYALGAGVWARSGDTAYRAGRAIEAGRVWTNTYHHTPRTRRSADTSSRASVARTTSRCSTTTSRRRTCSCRTRRRGDGLLLSRSGAGAFPAPRRPCPTFGLLRTPQTTEGGTSFERNGTWPSSLASM